MQIVFIIVAIVGLLYFLIAKRMFDFFSVAFISSCIYFLPGFFGFALAPSIVGSHIPEQVPLITETYCVMTAVLLAIIIGAICFDYIFRQEKSWNLTLSGSNGIGTIAVFIALIGFLMTFLTTGDALFSPDKAFMMEKLNRWYIVWTIGASLGATFSFLRKKIGLFLLSIMMLLFDVYIGFRSSLALTIIAIFTLWLASKGRQRLVIRHKFVILYGFLIGVFFSCINMFTSLLNEECGMLF